MFGNSGFDQYQAYYLQQQLDAAQASRTRYLFNPTLNGGYSEAKLMQALQLSGLAPGGQLGQYGTIGGVPMDALGFGFSNASQSGMAGFSNPFGGGYGSNTYGMSYGNSYGSGNGVDLFALGKSMSGPNGLVNQLEQKYYQALAQEQYKRQMAMQQQQLAWMNYQMQMAALAQAQQQQQQQGSIGTTPLPTSTQGTATPPDVATAIQQITLLLGALVAAQRQNQLTTQSPSPLTTSQSSTTTTPVQTTSDIATAEASSLPSVPSTDTSTAAPTETTVPALETTDVGTSAPASI